MEVCCSCQKPKAQLKCGACDQPLCKSCAQFVSEDHFSFWPQIPEILLKGTYCPPCYEEHVAPAQTTYDETMERAKDVNVMFKSQAKETRYIRRMENPISVKDCDDRDEIILRLAFIAASMGFNAILDVDLTSKKIKDGTYQTSVWHGTAIPANADEKRLNRS